MGAEQFLIGLIAHSTLEGNVDTKASSFLGPRFRRMSCTREKVAVLVQRQCHDTICAIKSFFDSISMMDININVQDSCVDLEEFQNCQDNIIDVTKSTGFTFFGMMKSSTPVDGNIALSLCQLNGPIQRGTGGEGAEFQNSIKDGTIGIFPSVESLHLCVVGSQIIW